MSLQDVEPLTRLEAVNMMLRAIGQTGVQSLEASLGNRDSENAQQELRVTLKTILAEGWHFNTEKGFPIDPNEAGEITIPNNALKVDTAGRSKQLDLVRRGTRLYDRVEHTYAIGKTVYVDMVIALEFEELTPTARYYVAVKATRRFASQEQGSVGSLKLTERDEQDARLRMEQEDAENDDRTMATASPHVARMRRGQRGAG